MRVHDVAFYEWLGTLLVDYGDLGGSAKEHFPILRVSAAPHRAYAAVVDLLVGQGFITAATAAEMREAAKEDFAILPLPIATIERDEPVPDPELPGTPTKTIRTMEWDGASETYITHRHPAHYKTEYRVTFWMQYKYTEAFIREWIMGQCGNKGYAENEFPLTVDHGDPWGSMVHAVKVTGSSDQSDLEGENPRYIRKEYTFSVRTWVMRLEEDGGELVEKTGADTYENIGDDGVLLDSAPGMDVQSDNLFAIRIPPVRFTELWPVEGNATVDRSIEFPPDTPPTRGMPFTMLMNVAEQADKVLLIETPTRLDSDGFDIFSISFQYRATGRVELEIEQRDLTLDTVSSADSLILPATSLWKKVHFWSVVNSGSYLARIAGITNQPDQEVYVSDISVHRVYPQTKIDPTDSQDLGDEVKYRWFSLATRPYLCIIATTSTTGGTNIITLEDDAAAPAHTVQRSLDSSVQVGLVFLTQPKSDSLALRVPKTTVVEAVYIQQFDGPYNGHTV